MVISAFDPVIGLGLELTRFALDPATDLPALDLSPDGTRIAAIRNLEGPIQILSLRGQAPKEIPLKGWKILRTVNWAADGKGLFVTSGIPQGAVLLHVDLQGNAQVLWKVQGANLATGRPSPDGRHLAVQGATWDGNMWMMENF
jgi:Tol biopolymer transport system component